MAVGSPEHSPICSCCVDSAFPHWAFGEETWHAYLIYDADVVDLFNAWDYLHRDLFKAPLSLDYARMQASLKQMKEAWRAHGTNSPASKARDKNGRLKKGDARPSPCAALSCVGADENTNAPSAHRGKMDKKMAKVTREMKSAGRDAKRGKVASALKKLGKAEKENVRLTKEDREVRDPLIERCKRGAKKHG